MKVKSVLKKLSKCGYEIVPGTGLNNYCYSATSGRKEIVFTAVDDGYSATANDCTVESVRYTDGSSKWKDAPNITFALRKLGDILPVESSSKPAGQRGVTKEALLKKYCSGCDLTSEQIKSLQIFCYDDVTRLFNTAFHDFYTKSRKRYSITRDRKERILNRKKADLWNLCIQDFLLDKSAEPLRDVEVIARVPGYDSLFDKYGSRVSNGVKVRTPIFARTAESAKTVVKSLMGDFADVDGAEIFAIAGQERSMEMYRKNLEKSSRKDEERFYEQAVNRVKEAELQLESAKLTVQLAEKKIELASFLENFCNVATISSQTDGIDLAAIFNKAENA